MLKIVQAETAAHSAYVRELFGEYLQWVGGMLQRDFGFNADIAAILEQDMRTLSKFAPPTGRLLLASDGGQVTGVGRLMPFLPIRSSGFSYPANSSANNSSRNLVSVLIASCSFSASHFLPMRSYTKSLIGSRIILPLAKPALAAVGVFAFVFFWNDFLGPLIIILPCLVLFFFSQNAFLKGITITDFKR